MQIKLRRASLAQPSERSSAATRLIANIFQRTDLVRQHCNFPLDGPRTVAATPRLPSQTPLGPHPRSSRHSIHIGHALGSGFVQSIFSPPPRRPRLECLTSVSRRGADLKILCITRVALIRSRSLPDKALVIKSKHFDVISSRWCFTNQFVCDGIFENALAVVPFRARIEKSDTPFALG
jgi:hypothetical protein